MSKRGGMLKALFALAGQRYGASSHGLDCTIAPQAIESTEAALQSLRVTPWEKLSSSSV